MLPRGRPRGAVVHYVPFEACIEFPPVAGERGRRWLGEYSFIEHTGDATWLCGRITELERILGRARLHQLLEQAGASKVCG